MDKDGVTLFILDERLASDTIFIADLELSKLLLMNNANFPWLILVPKINNITEIIELQEEEQVLLIREINLISKIMKDLFIPDKLNIAALGNIVAQLHIHIIARYKVDLAWPNPVFGQEKLLYTEESSQKVITLIKKAIA